MGEGMNEFEARLREAVAAVRAAFAGIPPGEPDNYWLESEAKELCKPIDQIGRFTFENYFSHAMTTWGGVNDFKRTLPLAIEILSTEPVTVSSEVQPFLLASKLREAKWQTWPKSQRRSVEAWRDAIWPVLLTRSPSDPMEGFELRCWLLELASLSGAIGPLLARWAKLCDDASTGEVPTWYLADRVDGYRCSNEKNGLLRRPKPETENEAIYFAWLISRETERRLAAAFFRATNESAAEAISAAQNWLEVYLDRRGVS